MKRVLRFFDALFTYLSVLLVCIFFAPAFLVLCVLAQSKKFQSKIFHQSTRWFFKVILAASRIKIVYNNFEVMPKKPVVFIANHQSSLDILTVGSRMDFCPLVWLARSELENSLPLKLILRCCAVVAEINDPQKSALSLRKLLSILKNSSVCPVIFPEGSRYADGLIHQFFNGFAFVARVTNRPVVPILIQNAFKVYPRGAFLINREIAITATQGPEFLILPDETLEAFTARVRGWFVQKNQ